MWRKILYSRDYESQQNSFYVYFTDTGSLRSVHANKDYRESGLMLLVDENGSVVYNDDLDHIKGRGMPLGLIIPKAL